MKTEQKPKHVNGVRINPKCKVFVPPSSSVGLERNLLGVPTFALSTSSASKIKKIVHEWVTADGRDVHFSFVRDPEIPFPTITHALIFDAMLALFATNFRSDGVLRFKISDILKVLGKQLDGGAHRAVKEAIRRYAYTTAHWLESWKTSTGDRLNWHGTLLVGEDILKREDHTKLKLNPRNSRDSEKWHSIKFHQKIVESVETGFTRIFATRVLALDISTSAKATYRYFYSFTDRSEIHRSLSHLKCALNFTDRDDRFEEWLTDALTELASRGLVETWSIKHRAVSVKCSQLKEIRIEKKQYAKKSVIAPKPIAPQAGLFDNLALIERYEADKAAGKLDVEKVEIIDLAIQKGQPTGAASAIRNLYSRQDSSWRV